MKVTRNDIEKYIDGALSPEKYQEIDAVIDRDASYRETYEQMLRHRDALGKIPLPSPPDWLAGRVVLAYKTERQSTIVGHPAVSSNRLTKVMLILPLYAPFLMLVAYSAFSLNYSNISFVRLAHELNNSWLIQILVAMNLFFIYELLIKNFHSLNTKHKIESS